MSQIELYEQKMNTSFSESGTENAPVSSNEQEIINAIRKDSFNIDLLNPTDVNNYLDNDKKFTALHFAAHFNRPAIVKLLLEEMKADIETRDEVNNTPVNIAARLGHDGVISVMINWDPECIAIPGQFESIPLHNACVLGHYNVVKVLTKHERVSEALCRRQLIAMTGKYGHTPLHLAASYGHIKIVEFLLEICCQLKIELNDLRNKCGGETPVHIAAYKGRSEIIKAMVKKYPDCLQYRDEYDGTAFLTACGYGHVQLAEQLRSKDETDAKTSNYQRSKVPLQLVRACKNGRTMIVRLLFNKGVIVHPEALVQAIRGGFSETAKELLSRSSWSCVLQHTYTNEDGEETTPFRELVQHMPDVAEIVLNKCMELTRRYKQSVHGPAVKFNYDYVDDFADSEPETSNSADVSNSTSTTWKRPQEFIKDLHPLSLIVKYKRQKLLNHPVVTSLVHNKWKRLGWISLLHWISYLVHLCFITTLALNLTCSNSQDSQCFTAAGSLMVATNNVTNWETNFDDLLTHNSVGNLTAVCRNETNFTSTCESRAKSATLIVVLASEAALYSLIGLVVRTILVLLALKRVCCARDPKEPNPLYHLHDIISCLVNGSTVSEIPLFIFSLTYVLPIYFLDECLCPYRWQSSIGTVVILLTWLEFIVLSTQFQFIGVYVLMLSKVLATFLKIAVLMCILIVGFSVVFYLSLNDPNIASSDFLSPGIALLKVIEGTVGEDFNSFAPTAGDYQLPSTVYPYSALTIILWIIFVIIMPILFTNLLIGLAVGDIQAIYDMANFEKQALQVEYILNVEDQLRRFGFTAKKPTSKAYHDYSLPEMIINRLIVLLWGGESFDSRQSNQMLLKHRQNFYNSHRFTPESKLATSEDISQLRNSLEQLIIEKM